MQNYLIYISYNGKNYAGYQLQKNANTVGAEIKKALLSLFGEISELHGCSRTDSGVHAKEFAVSFKAEKQMPEKTVVKALNAKFPSDISVSRCEYVPDSFHARYSVKKKEYRYVIYTGKTRDPFLSDFSYSVGRNLDIEKMNRAAGFLVGKHDFTAFKAVGGKTEDCVRTIFSAGFEENGNVTVFSIVGDGFLYKMVRLIVGTLIDVSDGKIKAEDIPEILKEKKQTPGFAAPPQGLFLYRVYYED